MIVALVIATEMPDVMVVLFRFISDPDVPQFPSTTAAPALVVKRHHVAVPDATALALVMALMVRTPPDAAGANVAEHGSSASFVVSVPPVAGRVPEKMRNKPLAPTADVMALSMALRTVATMATVMHYLR